jgi:glycosyltransferase involved in cell wall biosynthesis
MTPSRTMSAAGDKFLSEANSLYLRFVDQLPWMERRSRVESLARYVETAADYASGNHSGRFADGAIENCLVNCCSALPEANAPSRPVRQSPGRRRVLHVHTQTLPGGVGGPTRAIASWVETDRASHHTVVLTRQDDRAVPWVLNQAVQRSGADLQPLATGPLLARASQLRSLARSCDLVLLHHATSDVVPTIGLTSRDLPPVVVVNHTDHQFWLGGVVADAIAYLRPAGMALHDRRFGRGVLEIPIPLVAHSSQINRRVLRSRLGIPEDQAVILSVGRGLKYTVSDTHDFFEVATRILDIHRTAHLYVVGLSETDYIAARKAKPHDRVHLVGPVSNPRSYQLVADLYLEGMPFGSQTALLEAALNGVPVVRTYAPASPLLAADDIALDGNVPVPSCADEYVELASAYLSSPDHSRAIGHALRKNVMATHTGDGWRSLCQALYDAASRLEHRIQPLPTAVPERTPTDLAIAVWNAQKYRGHSASDRHAGTWSSAMLGAALDCRDRADYRSAARVLFERARTTGWSNGTVMAFGKLGAHAIGTSVLRKWHALQLHQNSHDCP